jgi:multiphosphoryl transfer protein
MNMVGIVIVSHSAELAAGIHALAQQMAPQARLAVAGGVDNPENPLGTDAMQVMAAIESVYSEAGVVVLMDLGSAILSAETALDFLPPEQRDNIHLCEAPLVEGALAAAVQAAAGGDAQQVMTEARGALAAKASQLHAAVPDSLYTPAFQPALAGQKIQLTVINPLGLHARPAAQFVTTASRFDTAVRLTNLTSGKGPVNGQSINLVTTLAVRQGHEIEIEAAGRQAAEALAALRELVESGFGETDDQRSTTADERPTTSDKRGRAIAASPGIALGPAFIYRPTLPEVSVKTIDDPTAEWERLTTAAQTAQQELEIARQNAVRQIGKYEAAIFDAHLLILQDPDLLTAVREQIFTEKINAEAAWRQAIEATAASYRALEEDYLQARAADVTDVGLRLLRLLTGKAAVSLTPPEPSILVAHDLTPSDTAELDPALILGICTELGGATSHSAILARALGIPAVVGAGPAVAQLKDGMRLALDGSHGRLWLEPDDNQWALLQTAREEWLAAQAEARANSLQPAVTKDGRHFELVANIRSAADARAALENGAEGVGLLRTEFLYLERTTAPSEDEQVAAYEAIAAIMGRRPLIIRTLDVGGDKPLAYLNTGAEDNPFLGWRGIRLCLDQPEILQTQLRAILRVSDGRQIKIMFPMIATVDETRAAKGILAEAQAELRAAGVPFDEEMEVGIMIETPAAVLIADLLAAEVDFFSIGSNDLTQYVMAADRGNVRVAQLADAYQPAVLRAMQQTITAAHAAGIWVGLCGELAGDPLATPLLVGLGLDEFSMSAPMVAAVKERIRQLTLAEAQEIAQTALGLGTAGEVRQFLAKQTAS